MSQVEIPNNLQVSISIPAFNISIQEAMNVFEALSKLPYGTVSPMLDGMKASIQKGIAEYAQDSASKQEVIEGNTAEPPKVVKPGRKAKVVPMVGTDASSEVKEAVKKAGRPKRTV
jgi:hypothetical protein